MLHLAQVQHNESSGGVELRLLACQQSENSWTVLNPEPIIPAVHGDALSDGVLVLLELSNTYEILSIKSAKDWVLDLLQKYLTTGVTPSFLQQEAERTEQWRQDLTLQSQDLTRRHLEMEARREQIQILEEDLKREKQQLESTAAQLKLKSEVESE
ncbi:MAG: hypothetical protein KME06_17255 [Kastovskya adunca ATA6-11-RM4]|jgi:hypothetical protein|nr:hypothetical protein [Kastovskya adunca ATA6-11-RM4]